MPRPGRKRFRALQTIFCWSLCTAGWSEHSLFAEEFPPPNALPAPSALRAEIRKVVRDSFHYDPSVRQKMLAAKNQPHDVTTMETVVVLESTETPGFRAHLDQKRRDAENAKPSVAHGLTLLALPAVTAGIVPYVDRMPFGATTPRWTLLNLRW